jgi:hypothetical protein
VKIEERTAAEFTTRHKALMEEFQRLCVYLPEINRQLPGVFKGIMDAHKAGRLTREQALLEAYISPSLTLASIDDRLEHRLANYTKNLIALGRRMVDLRDGMGEQNFKDALATACPKVPWEDAFIYMRTALEAALNGD